MTRWKPIGETENWKKKQKRIKVLLIGGIISVIALLLSACSRIEYVYVETPREPITCIDSIKTPLDMAKCLSEYKVKY